MTDHSRLHQPWGYEFWDWKRHPDEAAGAGRRFGDETVIETRVPGDEVAFGAAHAATPHLHVWRSEAHSDVVLRPTAQPERLLIYLPGPGRIDVETKDGKLICDGANGLCTPLAAVERIHKYAGRAGGGLTVAQGRLRERLSNLLRRPLHKPLVFERQFKNDGGGKSPVEVLITAVLEPSLATSLRRSHAAACEISWAIIDVLLESLPHNYSHLIGVLRATAMPAHIRRALEIIETIDDPAALNTADLAHRCGVSARTLQYGFRDFLDQSPASYARSLRLARARADILLDPRRPLSQTARRWGFANPTRFKRAFSEAFGVSPMDVRALAIDSPQAATDAEEGISAGPVEDRSLG